jgi:hypothetical protein
MVLVWEGDLSRLLENLWCLWLGSPVVLASFPAAVIDFGFWASRTHVGKLSGNGCGGTFGDVCVMFLLKLDKKDKFGTWLAHPRKTGQHRLLWKNGESVPEQ